jgi:hypothetical protein
MPKKPNRYIQIIEEIFSKHYQKNDVELIFDRDEFIETAEILGIKVPKNLGDLVYSFRYRANLPARITATAKEGHEWLIRPIGRAKYKFALVPKVIITPNNMMSQTKIPDSTPGIIAKYSFDDEQALLAIIRYNRLIDIFTGLTCYSLQSHLRTTVPNIGQVETDEIYIGLDKRGAHFILPVQAKSHHEKVGVIQIEQDIALCKTKLPGLICKPIAAQFIDDDVVVLFEFIDSDEGLRIANEKHYKLVSPEDLSEEEVRGYGCLF